MHWPMLHHSTMDNESRVSSCRNPADKQTNGTEIMKSNKNDFLNKKYSLIKFLVKKEW